MSGGAAPPAFVPAPAPSVLTRIGAPAAPTFITTPIPGLPGPPGPQGARGPQGVPGDYGSIRYDEVNATPILLTPDQSVPFTLAAPVTMTNSLRGPFANFTFLLPDGATLQARANGDSYLIRARMSVVAVQAGGSFTTDLVIPGVSGLSSTRPRSLLKPAGTPDLVDELFQAFPGNNFVANGATLMLTSSVVATVIPQTLFVTPIEAV